MTPSTYLSLLNRRQWLRVLLLGSVTNTIFRATGSPAKQGATKPGAPPIPQSLATHLAPGSNDSAIIPIRISEFPGLSDSWGSVSVYFSNLQYPIVINRDDNNHFFAINPTCTHQGCQVENYNPGAFCMECLCHGSKYSIDGRVSMGPAQYDLPVYPCRFDGGNLLEIELLGVPLRIDRVTVQSRTAAGTRLQMEFPGVSGCKYQVNYYANLSSPPQSALFALAPGDPADQSSFTVPQYTPADPLSGDGIKKIWVDAPGSTGFFTIEMVLGESTPL